TLLVARVRSIRLHAPPDARKICPAHCRGSGTIAHSRGQNAVPRLKGTNPTHTVDRRSWAGGRSFVNCGVRVGIRVDDPSLLARWPAYFPPGSKPTSHLVDRLCSLERVDRGRSGPRLARIDDGSTTTWPPFDVDTELDSLRGLFEYYVATGATSRL